MSIKRVLARFARRPEVVMYRKNRFYKQEATLCGVHQPCRKTTSVATDVQPFGLTRSFRLG